MTGRITGAFVALLAVALTGCGGDPAGGGEREIVVTTNILGDVVGNIVGDAAPVRVLMQPNADPHSFGVSAQDAAAMSGAGLVVANGLGLEEGVQRHVDAAAAAGVPTLAVGNRIDPLSYTEGDSAGTPDPHFWMDPQRMVAAVDAITTGVVAIDGIDPAVVEANAERYRARLRDLDGWMTAAFDGLPVQRRKLVTNHHVLGYLADRYGFTVVGAIVPSGTTLAAPSSSDLRSLVSAIESTRVPAIFVDSSQPEKLARVLAEQADVQVDIIALYSESLGPPGTSGATYVDMMRANTESIVAGLR